AALAETALDADLPAEQSRDLAADREAEPGPAVAAAGRSVRLLEGLEDQAQLVVRDPDARVHHGEGDDGVGTRQRLAGELPSFGELDAQRHTARIGELERVREQVLQDLLQALLVRLECRRDVRAVHL